MEIEEHIQGLREQLRLEEKAQIKRWESDGISNDDLRKDGALLSPVKITNKHFNYAEHPVLTLNYQITNGIDATQFNEGLPIALFALTADEQCHAKIISISDKKIEISLHTADFPEWIEENKLGIKRLPDSRSFKYMHAVLENIQQQKKQSLHSIYAYLTGFKKIPTSNEIPYNYSNQHLNSSQQNAVQDGLNDAFVNIIHGPPGTGKTTTIVALIMALRKAKKRVIAAAPSNAALDHLAQLLHKSGLRVLRLGNTSKIDDTLLPYTPEGIIYAGKAAKELKKLRIQAEEYRKLAQQYKRKFGKKEQEERKTLYQNATAIKKEIRATIHYYLERYLEETDVVLGTPIGLQHTLLKDQTFDVAILDEAGQCQFPMGLLVAEKAKKIILVGDHYQIPPTVISNEAAKKGLDKSILECAIESQIKSNLLEIQYRMTPEIAGFSSHYFYEGKLKSHLSSLPNSLEFYDTAGAGFQEVMNDESWSYSNPDEISIIEKQLPNWQKEDVSLVFISPYSGQVNLAKERLQNIKTSTIDAFQGQEAETIILSLVRNNANGNIGFLSDYRRMNVALTRAKKKLIIIGDSTTLAKDEFYTAFIAYTEEINVYHSVFELMY